MGKEIAAFGNVVLDILYSREVKCIFVVPYFILVLLSCKLTVRIWEIIF